MKAKIYKREDGSIAYIKTSELSLGLALMNARVSMADAQKAAVILGERNRIIKNMYETRAHIDPEIEAMMRKNNHWFRRA